jgi:tRNA(Ile)-lysidine synthase
VLVAASGGADSTALLLLLRFLAPRLDATLVGLAHFNHGLRGRDADLDEDACRDLAEQVGLPFVSERGDVAGLASAPHVSLEDAGRRLRYAFFERAASHLGATRVAVGHTKDDQAETVLLNLLRGAGTRGVAGIPVRRGVIVRPLIDCRHDELVEWLTDQRVAFREDASNRDPRFLRNRVRHELLPVARKLEPALVEGLTRTAEIARADADLLDQLARQAFEQRPVAERQPVRIVGDMPGPLAEPSPAELTVGRAWLANLPPALATRVARLALESAAPGRSVGFEHSVRLVRLASVASSSGRHQFPGQTVEVLGDILRLSPAGPASVSVCENGPIGTSCGPFGTSSRFALSIPGEASFGQGCIVSAQLRPGVAGVTGFSESWNMSDPTVVAVDGSLFAGLVVRSRRPGDRFRPFGMAGHKKLQDYFVDLKVPRRERDLVPIVATEADDRIVWVAGYGISEDFRVRVGSHPVVILRLRGERA